MTQTWNRLTAVIMTNLRASPGQSAVLLVATLVLIVMLVRQFGGEPALAEAGPALATAVRQPETGDVPTAATGHAPPAVHLQPRPRLRHTLARDPFAGVWLGLTTAEAAAAPAFAREGLLLQCTMLGSRADERATAVINGILVFPGATLGPFEVVRIGARHVVLSDGAKTIDLRMP